MKKMFFTLLAAIVYFSHSSAQLTNTGNIVTGTGTYLVLNDLSLVNNGTFTQSYGTVKFSGSGNHSISASSAIQFYNFELNKTGNAEVQLQNSISVINQLSFNGGLLYLNGNNILLQSTGNLINENENSRIYGTSGYVETISIDPTNPNPGNLGAIISSSQNLGSTIIRRGHSSQTNGGGAGNSILRYFDITPTNNNSLDAIFRFTYLDAELNGLDENALVMWKSVDNIHWTNQGYTNRDVVTNYVEKTVINDFSRWTLSDINNPLPILWSFFNTKCVNDHVIISWKTEVEINTQSFIVERSSNGSQWNSIGSVAAAGNGASSRSYVFNDNQPSQSGNAYYRIKELDIDGHVIYSPVLINNCGNREFFKIYPNPVQDNLWIAIQSVAGGSAMISLYDAKGALVLQQQQGLIAGLNQFNLNVSQLSTGLYSLVITINDGKIKLFKLEKM